MDLETDIIHTGGYIDKEYGSMSNPIFQTSVFASPDLDSSATYKYTRFANPNRSALETALAHLEDAHSAFALCSGTAAMFAALSLLSAGDHILINHSIYGGTHVQLNSHFKRYGITYTAVDYNDLPAVQAALTPKTRMIWVESPVNPTLYLVDIQKVAEIAHGNDALLVVDNTLMTPLWQQPLKLGADVVIHSTSKYLNGHCDVVGGAVLAKSPEIATQLKSTVEALGLGQAPYDAWLTHRGLKTLPLRMAAHGRNAEKIVNFLTNSPQITQVYYPGLNSHPAHELAQKQQSHPGAIVSFTIDPQQIDLDKFFKSLEIIKLGYSLGALATLISHPWTRSHSRLTEPERRAVGVSPEMVRISVGVEHPEDLITDLQNAFQLSTINQAQPIS